MKECLLNQGTFVTDIMMTTEEKNNDIVVCAYRKYRQRIFNYISCRIKDSDEAQDLAQDVFVKLLACKRMLREDTVRHFLYSIARNVITDHVRHSCRKKKVDDWLALEAGKAANGTEERIYAEELLGLERKILSTFPRQRRTVYALSVYEGRTAKEIAEALNLSRRTVECHLLLGRRSMREAMKACV